MRKIRWLPLVIAGVLGVALLAGASAAAFRAHVAKTTTLKYFFKSTGSKITNSAGKNVSSPAPGDHLFATVKMYAGTSKHHAAGWTGSAFAYCTITKVVSAKDIRATCNGVVSIGGSMLTSVSNQNVAATTNVYPISGGTGKYVHVKGGSVKTTAVGKSGSSNAVITIKG